MQPCRRWIPPFARVPQDLEEELRRGGVVVYPTETVYGLGGNPEIPGVLDRIYGIKGRPSGKALPLIAADVETVRQWVVWRPDPLDRLADAFWPGPLTLVLEASPRVPKGVASSEGTVAVRVSSHPVAGMLARACGGWIVATSANLSGQPPVSDPAALPSALLHAVDGLVDGGPLVPTPPSTLVAVRFRHGRVSWAVLREGAVSRETLSLFFGRGETAAAAEEL
ncbi:L-threonylcarbamoyladenylate synthase [Desulfosoma sp.]